MHKYQVFNLKCVSNSKTIKNLTIVQLVNWILYLQFAINCSSRGFDTFWEQSILLVNFWLLKFVCFLEGEDDVQKWLQAILFVFQVKFAFYQCNYNYYIYLQWLFFVLFRFWFSRFLILLWWEKEKLQQRER